MKRLYIENSNKAKGHVVLSLSILNDDVNSDGFNEQKVMLVAHLRNCETKEEVPYNSMSIEIQQTIDYFKEYIEKTLQKQLPLVWEENVPTN